MESEPSLSGEEIQKLVLQKLDEYKDLSFLEQYAMFMGKAQILEFGLKRLLARKYSVPIEDMERWTLGRVKNELEQKGLRPDFIALLNSVVQYRNYIAHELLANNALFSSIVEMSPHMEGKELWKGTYELEQIIVLHDWCEEHNAWD
jgi:hypothetical protein